MRYGRSHYPNRSQYGYNVLFDHSLNGGYDSLISLQVLHSGGVQLVLLGPFEDCCFSYCETGRFCDYFTDCSFTFYWHKHSLIIHALDCLLYVLRLMLYLSVDLMFIDMIYHILCKQLFLYQHGFSFVWINTTARIFKSRIQQWHPAYFLNINFLLTNG